MSVLSRKEFHNEAAAYKFIEARIWPQGAVCPHCGGCERIGKLEGKTTRIGVYKCYQCRKPFTVKVGTIFEDSHVKLNLWLQAIYLMASSKKGISANQLHRTLGVTLKTAWFMSHRIREAMREGTDFGPLGGTNKVVEADETYVGGKEKNKHANKRIPGGQGGATKEVVMSLVERKGRVRSFYVANVTSKTIRPIIQEQIAKETHIMSDESNAYPAAVVGHKHSTVNHGLGEYVRAGFYHTNTVEGYFSTLKRGINGTYHHVSQQHLKRYLAEFDFRYNERTALGVDDVHRADKLLLGVTWQAPNISNG